MASTNPARPERSAVPESLFSRLIIGPVIFVSFLVSLVLVDRETYSSIFGKGQPGGGYYHSHQRKLAKTEMDEAFQKRSKVLAGMCLLSGLAVGVIMWGLSIAWHALKQRQV